MMGGLVRHLSATRSRIHVRLPLVSLKLLLRHHLPLHFHRYHPIPILEPIHRCPTIGPRPLLPPRLHRLPPLHFLLVVLNHHQSLFLLLPEPLFPIVPPSIIVLDLPPHISPYQPYPDLSLFPELHSKMYSMPSVSPLLVPFFYFVSVCYSTCHLCRDPFLQIFYRVEGLKRWEGGEEEEGIIVIM